MQALINQANQRVKAFGAQYTTYGLFGMGNAIFFYLFWHYLSPTGYESLLFRAICFALCLVLVLYRQWPTRCRPLLPLYWHIVLLITLPYFFSYMLVMNHGAIMWLLWIMPIAFFVFLLVDVSSALILLSLGIALGVLTATYHLMLNPILFMTHRNQSFSLIGFVVSYGVSIFMSAIFSRNRQLIEAFQREKHQLKDKASSFL
ncbi:MAG: hypothetical protein GY821_09340 [Gammaproteobacteria bacterium]|nr:hypothetical protein [Gammaproteobacteria bacterium]